MEWIDASVRQPDHDSTVLVYCCRIFGVPLYYLATWEDGEWLDEQDGSDLTDSVVRWAEIPPPEGLG